MRILFASLAAYGHIYPMVPLALALRKAGHSVTFATTEPFHPLLTSFELDPVPAGIGMTEAFAQAGGPGFDPKSASPQRLPTVIAEVFGAVLPRAFAKDLHSVLEEVKPDLVINEAANHGGVLAAIRVGVPQIRHGLSRVTAFNAGPQALAWKRVVEVAAELGVPDYPAAPEAVPYLDIYPESMQEKNFLRAPRRIPIRPVPVSEPGELPAWVITREASRPLVYLTLGTAFSSVPVLRMAIDGLAALDVDVLVAAGPLVDTEALGHLPDNVHVERWLPQADLLQHLDLVVHHGGTGTTLGALANALPQLVLPQGADQFINAEALVTSGAGVRLAGAEVSAEAIAERATELLTDGKAREAARAVAAEIAAMPAPEDVVPKLISFASAG